MKQIKRNNHQSAMAQVNHKPSSPVAIDYESVFLSKNNLTQRKTVYVADELRNKVSQVVMSMRNREMTVGMYIENIILHHFQTYKSEINSLCERKFEKLL